MAERRMFAKTVIDSDAFLEMPLSAQALYFHLSMRADDEGFVNNPKKIQRMINASDDDCKLLVLKRFILTFESGVIVIKHWKIHNYIRNDRFKGTIYTKEKSTLFLNEHNAYTERSTLGIPNDGRKADERDTQLSVGKDSIESGKDKINYNEIKDFYNETCVSFPKVQSLSVSRKKAIKARLGTYTIEQIKNVFVKAQASDFLKGKNQRNWRATFDWILTDGNFVKILDGNYDNSSEKNQGNSIGIADINAKVARERWYAARKSKAEGKAEKIYERFMQNEEFKRIERRLNSMQREMAECEIKTSQGNKQALQKLAELEKEKERLILQRRNIIERNELTEEDLLPQYACRKCNDTGYLPDGRLCDCYEKEKE